MVMGQGKTNQLGKREYAACIRNREIIACPVGALAFYLFYRWYPQPGPGEGEFSGFHQPTALV